MIELVSEARCIECDLCIKVCPTNVFDRGPAGLPVIARQDDCQTCFLCEAYCPVDALFVAPATSPVPATSPYLRHDYLEEANLFGKYRRDLGWGPGRETSAHTDATFTLFRSMHPPTAPAEATAPAETAAAIRT